VEKLDASLRHPGLPLLLLYRFAPITDSEDGERAVSLLRRAWNDLRLFSEVEIAQFIERFDCRDQGFEWQMDHEKGWFLYQDDKLRHKKGLYTLRYLENPEFPFEQFNVMVRRMRESLG
jgi:hypothetical protein